MKNCIQHLGFTALLMVIVMVICSCSKLDDDPHDRIPPNSFIKWTGGVLTAFEGNLILTFPKDAVHGIIDFKVNMCLDQEECNYLIRPVFIEPVTDFHQPVSVMLKYDGILANSPLEIPENTMLVASVWESETDVLNNQSCGNCICTVDRVAHTITFCIGNSGIITIARPKPSIH